MFDLIDDKLKIDGLEWLLLIMQRNPESQNAGVESISAPWILLTYPPCEGIKFIEKGLFKCEACVLFMTFEHHIKVS